MMKIGLIELTHETGISQPNRSRFRRWSEYTVSTVNCCWYSDQNATDVMNSGRKPHTRLRSSAVTRLLVRITAKYAIAAAMTAMMTITARLSARMTPVSTSTTITATPAIAMPIISG